MVTLNSGVASMKRILLILSFTLCLLNCKAQYFNQSSQYIKGNSVWAFGLKAGYNLNTHLPFNTALQSEEGCASVASRTTGNLLFLSDGKSAWNKNLQVMTQANGNLLGNNLNNGTTAQGVCIVPFINDTNKYYLFSMQPQGGYSLSASKGKLYYSVVDMTLSAGNGNVVATQKNILLDSFLSESMISIPGNNCDMWLMVHTVDSAVFKAYHITAAGVDPVPVRSQTGSQISGFNTYVVSFGGQPFNYIYGAYMIGCMAVSPDRTKIAITSTISNFGTLSAYAGLAKGSLVCDFDAATGTVSNALLLDTIRCYGAAFSPDNSKLYISTAADLTPSSDLIQYDITNYNVASIMASRFTLHQSYSGGFGMKVYNDTMYVAYGGSSNSTPYLNRVNNPNLLGAAANYQSNAITLATNTSCNFILNNDVAYPLPPDTIGVVNMDTSLCEAAWSSMVLHADNGFSSYKWNDGSTDSLRTVYQSGIYWVLCKDACHSRVDSFYIHAAPPDTAGVAALDTLVCKAFENIPLKASSGYAAYVWNDGSTDSLKLVNEWGTYWVLCKDSCHNHVDTFKIRGADMDFDLGNDTALCSPIIFPVKVSIDNANYLWQDGKTVQTYNVQQSGAYQVDVTKNGCVATDAINVNYINLRQSLGKDTTFCLGSPFTMNLIAQSPIGSSVFWNTGSQDRAIDVRDTGNYFVTVKQEQCTGTDSIHIGYVICECAYLMPNAFSPNGDGNNDVYKPALQSGCATSKFVLNIYNRFGQRVFTGYNPQSGWDGTFNGTYCDVGTYFYEINFIGGSRKIEYNQKGDIILIR
jgi:gliding motility-associated-like protein